MNPTLKVINSRKSVRAYQDQAIPVEAKQKIIHAAMRAPTAGNLMLYTILDITDQAIKEKLSVTCDHQPFIARAPMVLIFLADYQRIYDYFNLCAVPEMCRETGHPLRPAEGDLFLACLRCSNRGAKCSDCRCIVGIGSCYIGDIMENYETHRGCWTFRTMYFRLPWSASAIPQSSKNREHQPAGSSKNILSSKTATAGSTRMSLQPCSRTGLKVSPPGSRPGIPKIPGNSSTSENSPPPFPGK